MENLSILLLDVSTLTCVVMQSIINDIVFCATAYQICCHIQIKRNKNISSNVDLKPQIATAE